MLRARVVVGLVFSLAAWAVTPATAHAQSDCERARACCEAMASASGGTPGGRCAQLAAMPAGMCGQILAGMMAGASRMGPAVAAACGGGGGGGGGAGTTAPTPPGTPPPPEGPPGPHGPPGGTASPPPVPIPPDSTAPTHAQGGSLACVLDRVGHRVVVSGQVARFNLRCSGIPVAGNPTGAGEPTAVPAHTADGAPVTITWRSEPGSADFLALGSTAGYTAPARVNPADVRVTATVTVPPHGTQAAQSVSVTRMVRVVPRNLRLQMESTTVNRCVQTSNGMGVGSLNLGYTHTCSMSVDLTVSDTLAVTSTGSGTCGAGQATGIEPCRLMGQTFVSGAEAVPGWNLASAQGQIDPETGIVRFQVTGQRVGGLRVHFTNGRVQEPDTHTLFPLPFEMEARDGATRSFGSLNTTPQAGGTNAFTLHAR